MHEAPRPILSAAAKVELLVAAVFVYLFLHFQGDIAAWLERLRPASVQTSALGKCRPPFDFEQLHVVVAQRDGELVLAGCMYVAAPGGYVK